MIHTYTLIHDDLPAMDDDDMRRGKPTTHKKFGEDIAILAGDMLNTLAFEVIAANYGNITSKMIVEIGSALGIDGVVGGQAGGSCRKGQKDRPQRAGFHTSRKTACLFIAAVACGGIGGRRIGGGARETQAVRASSRTCVSDYMMIY